MSPAKAARPVAASTATGLAESDRPSAPIGPELNQQRDRSKGDASNSGAVLASLAQEINEQDESRRACEVKGVMHGFRIGQLLLEAKKITPHGEFLDWVKSNTRVTPRMCQIYMRVARSPRLQHLIESDYETVSHLTLTKAIKLDPQPKSRENAYFREMVKSIRKAWNRHLEHRREFVRCLGEAREDLFKDDDEGFKRWLVDNASVGAAFAEKIPGLLDNVEYDDEAWTEAMLDDIIRELNVLSALREAGCDSNSTNAEIAAVLREVGEDPQDDEGVS